MRGKLFFKAAALMLALITLNGCASLVDLVSVVSQEKDTTTAAKTTTEQSDVTTTVKNSATQEPPKTDLDSDQSDDGSENEEKKDPMEGMTNPYTPLNYGDMKAIWLSQFDLNSVYCASSVQRNESDYRRYLATILDNVAANGFNTVIVQVRPNADSMYPSDYYPMSKYVVGGYGREARYDPFAIMIEEAHARNLSVQAWINPMRAMTTTEITSVPKDYAIRQWYDNSSTRGKYVVSHNGNYYLNPAYEEVRRLIIDGAREILIKYDVDGLHMDDYFYPTESTVFDASAYSEYRKSGGTKGVSDFRREMLNLLISNLYAAVKVINSDMIFGISPAGNINNVRRDCADVDTWCSTAGYIDYICPQIYFGMEHQTYDFVSVCQTWQKLIKIDSVKLIIGMSLGKAKSKVDNYAGSGKNEWAEHDDILKRCLEHTVSLDRCVGVAYFCYQYFYHPTAGTEESATKSERINFIPVLREISWEE